jgi:hypothetical protein
VGTKDFARVHLLTLGKEYGLATLISRWSPEPMRDAGPFALLHPDRGTLVSFSLSLFDITDPGLPAHWQTTVAWSAENTSYELRMGPEALITDLEGYLERLKQDDPATLQHFHRLMEELVWYGVASYRCRIIPL